MFRFSLRYVTLLTRRVRIRRRRSSGLPSRAAVRSVPPPSTFLWSRAEFAHLASGLSGRVPRVGGSPPPRAGDGVPDERRVDAVTDPSSLASFSSWSSASLRSSRVGPFRLAFCRSLNASLNRRSSVAALRGSGSSEHTTSTTRVSSVDRRAAGTDTSDNGTGSDPARLQFVLRSAETGWPLGDSGAKASRLRARPGEDQAHLAEAGLEQVASARRFVW
jgi:hypothetical protein